MSEQSETEMQPLEIILSGTGKPGRAQLNQQKVSLNSSRVAHQSLLNNVSSAAPLQSFTNIFESFIFGKY
jgi:hypothetical protein